MLRVCKPAAITNNENLARVAEIWERQWRIPVEDFVKATVLCRGDLITTVLRPMTVCVYLPH